MQLTRFRSISVALASATAGLFTMAPADAAKKERTWEVDSTFYVYSEQDRVTVIEPVAQGKSEVADDEFVSVTVVADAMTGASPNGAIATAKPQTFTAASGSTGYSTPANTLPLHSFKDLRVAVAIDWDKPLSRLSRSLIGASVSQESDYTSLGASATLTRDTEDKLTTFSIGAALALDIIRPQGGAPEPLMPPGSGTGRSDDDEGENRGGRDDDDDGEGTESESKTITDMVVGVTQVISPRMLTQLNYGLGFTQGYLNDPYKIISIVEPITGETFAYRTEKRPDSRLRQTLFAKAVYHFTEDVVHVSYRYYADDWGLRAHTTDLKYRLELGARHYLQPHLRYYHQGAADFFRHSLVGSVALPQYASADLRLAEMTSYTVGLKYGFPLAKRHELSARVEHMRQQGNSHPSSAIGVQKAQDLYPQLTVWMAQLGYSFEF